MNATFEQHITLIIWRLPYFISTLCRFTTLISIDKLCYFNGINQLHGRLVAYLSLSATLSNLLGMVELTPVIQHGD